MVNWYGLLIASFVTLIIPIWIIGWNLIPMRLKFIFSLVGVVVVWYTVEYGGIRRGLLTK